MPTYSLTLETSLEDAEPRSADLWDQGAQGVEVRDGELLAMPGDAPPQGRAILVGWFTDRESGMLAAEALGGRLAEIAEQDWGESWKKGLGPISVGRVFVRPSWIEATAPTGAAEVVLDPGMAFGTGTHPTTALCLGALSEILASRPGASVLDVGTGSGLLAIAARKLGAGRVMGIDNDPVAVKVAKENAALNGVALELVEDPLASLPGTFDVVVANILANTLVDMAPDIAQRLAPGGVAVVSGILAPQADHVREAYVGANLSPSKELDRQDGEWVVLGFRRVGPR